MVNLNDKELNHSSSHLPNFNVTDEPVYRTKGNRIKELKKKADDFEKPISCPVSREGSREGSPAISLRWTICDYPTIQSCLCPLHGYCLGNQRRSFKYNLPRNMTTTCDSSATKTRCRRSPDSCAEDACLAKNLLRSVASDDDDDGAATGRLRPPTVQQSGCPCTSTSSAWKISGMLAVPSRDCPICWAQLPAVDDCENCSADANQPSHRWSTPGIRITSSAESSTFPTSAWIHGDEQDDADLSMAKRRCTSLTADPDNALSPVPYRSVPDIARNSVRGCMPPTSAPPSRTGDKWLSAGMATLPRTTIVRHADVLPACLRCSSN